MANEVTIRLTIDTGFIGGEHEKDIHIPRDRWDSMSKEERDKYIGDDLEDFKNEQIGAEAEVVEGTAPDDKYKYGEF